MPLEWDIAIGAIVRRREDIHGGGPYPIRFGGAWYGGIEPSGRSPNVLIFTEPEAGGLYGYDFDGWAPGNVLHYTGEGKLGDQRLVQGNRAILEHRKSGRSLRVFRAKPPFATYLGEFSIDEAQPFLWADAPDADGIVRQVVVFRLRPLGEFIRADLPNVPVPESRSAVTEDFPAEENAPIVADVSPEINAASSFTVEPSNEPAEYQRREAALLDRYKNWLRRRKRRYGRKRITLPDDAGRLYTDLHDLGLDELIEAKGSASRVSVRLGLGQLLDYARFVPHASKALLLPARPRPDLVDLLREHDCSCIWESGSGVFERIP
ncbi:MAG: hypothetical protein SF182_04675 [Deltaproteobacteria bacterium]|nr:hypothetical protein [Deltaproteobacteria bacterium]